MTVPTMFVTRLNVALSRDTAMISLGSPSGPVEGGQITHEEALRVVLSHATLRELAGLLSQRVFELDAMMAPTTATPNSVTPPSVAEEEQRSVVADNDDDGERSRLQ